MKIAVLGCGRWGAFHAWYAAGLGHDVVLWGRPGGATFTELSKNRKNEYLTLPSAVDMTDDLAAALFHAEVVIVAVASQGFRRLSRRIAAEGLWRGADLVLCMKGLEAESGKRLSEVAAEEMSVSPAVWVGPGHVQDFVAGMPNCMLVASEDEALTKRIAGVFSGPLIRFYYGGDLIGAEVGAAAKNVMGIAAGMLDGLGRGSLKGALMARGARELSRLVAAMGGEAMTVYGLSHLGDYEATLFSPHSNNRRYGEEFVAGKRPEKLAEGIYTADALHVLSARCGVELPIVESVRRIIHGEENPKDALMGLFLRPMTQE